MDIQLYNTLTNKKEIFKPLKARKAGIYTCGPTVYWYQHIGNMRTRLLSDILRRVLEYNKYEVNQVINVTDVGHLVADSDDGEDKIELAAKKEGKTAEEIAQHYYKQFVTDSNKLNMLEPTTWSWATKHIQEQIEMIQTLEKKGHTYKTSDGIYFDTTSFPAYGKLSNKKLDDLQGGKRISLGEKKNKTDFALWKLSKEKNSRLQEWDSPWGVGFPGWHIECSAMASKYLGEQFDIHTGGEDLMHLHHENEIAQSECALGTYPWVKTWMHGAFLNLEKEKMSKSSGSIITLSELEEQGVTPLQYKYFTYTAHYRKPLTWSKNAINTAKESYNRIKEITKKINDDNKEVNKEYINQFHERINDDLDMPGALAILWKLLRDKEAKGKNATIKKMDEVFALNLLKKENIDIPKEITKLAEERQKARKNKDWEMSDELREQLLEKGWYIKDEKEGYSLSKN